MVFGIIFLLSVSFISAGWFSDLFKQNNKITGNVISITDGLVAYYNFDNNVADGSGNGNNGIIYGGATFTTGVLGQAIKLDGVDDYVRYSSTYYNKYNSLTLTGWIKAPQQKSKRIYHE